jgi:hypothetical protein
MDTKNKTLAGLFLFVAGAVDVLGIAFGESFGSGFIWNLSIFLFGLFIITSVWFIQKAFKLKVFSTLLIVAGIGAVGAAFFCGCNGLLLSLIRDKPLLYYPFAIAQYIALGCCGILSYRFTKRPFSYICVILGLASLIVFGVWISSFKISYSGTTIPSILVDYSQSVWLIGFSTYMLEKDLPKNCQSKEIS